MIDPEVKLHTERPARLNVNDPRAWDQEAACTKYMDPLHPQYDAEMVWCSERARPRPREKEVCWTECPVRRQCLTWAISQGEKFCIYGGYNFGQRRRIWSRWRKEEVLPDPEKFPRITIDPEEIWRIISESSTSQYGDSPNPVPIHILMSDEPTEAELRLIEGEET